MVRGLDWVHSLAEKRWAAVFVLMAWAWSWSACGDRRACSIVDAASEIRGELRCEDTLGDQSVPRMVSDACAFASESRLRPDCVVLEAQPEQLEIDKGADHFEESMEAGSDMAGSEETPMPVVLLALDTSVRVQYLMGSFMVLPECHEQRQQGFQYGKSRWIVLLEVLTGSFVDYWCKYDDRSGDVDAEDFMYSVPHVWPMGLAPDGLPLQNNDGLLDKFGEKIRFALMTLDCKYQAGGFASDGFSYGPDLLCGTLVVNDGGKNPGAEWGALVPPSGECDAGLSQVVADEIQEELLAARPYGPRPLAALLDDARFFFSTETACQAECGLPTGDGTCSPARHVVLIASNLPTMADCGYPTALKGASALVELGVQVHVIALDTPEGCLPTLNKIAMAGYTGGAVWVGDAAGLAAALESIFTEVSAAPCRSIGP